MKVHHLERRVASRQLEKCGKICCFLPGAKAGPLLEHTVDLIADGASWLIWCCVAPREAPAKILADKTAAMVEEHGQAMTKRSLGTTACSQKNAA